MSGHRSSTRWLPTEGPPGPGLVAANVRREARQAQIGPRSGPPGPDRAQISPAPPPAALRRPPCRQWLPPSSPARPSRLSRRCCTAGPRCQRWSRARAARDQPPQQHQQHAAPSTPTPPRGHHAAGGPTAPPHPRQVRALDGRHGPRRFSVRGGRRAPPPPAPRLCPVTPSGGGEEGEEER
nr:uncharacterized protein LOC127310598 [Lolium perenne]